jgi:MYXO-CTERM domain-containing protein
MEMLKKNRIRRFLLAGALALLSTSGHAATVVLQNHSSNISVGDEFVIDVLLQDAFSGDLSGEVLLAFGLNSSYDNAAFTLTSRTVGPLWDDDTSFLDLDLAGSVFPGIENDGSNAPILLGQLTFAALAPGNFTLWVGSDPLDLNQGLIYLFDVGDISAQTQVSVQPVPAPAAGWLLASGLLALFRMRRRS